MSDQKQGDERQNSGEALYDKVARYSWLVSAYMGAGAFLFLLALTIGHFKVSGFNWPDALNWSIWVVSPLLISIGSFWRYRASDTELTVMQQTFLPSPANRNRILSFCAGLCIGSSGLMILALFVIALKTSQKHGHGSIALYSVLVLGVGITISLIVLLINGFRRAAPETFKPWAAALGVITILLVIASALFPH